MAEPGTAHVFSLRVYYEDTDAGGIVYYANYLKFAERARTELLRAVGADHAGLMADDGVAFTVKNCTIDFQRPARLDDALEVHTRFLEVGGASMSAEQVVQRGEEELVRMTVRLACVGSSGRPARLPVALRDVLKPLQTSH
ncbi:MAG: tol-pal system-associated acyl-CoA thioesterase [Alphaproteobacteria bacterium]|jgi:acyl-CoA thioester hydrolase|nr:tol-pal system-associated acyl-CoA thioesterase [Alphaproteobacteria bacterium]